MGTDRSSSSPPAISLCEALEDRFMTETPQQPDDIGPEPRMPTGPEETGSDPQPETETDAGSKISAEEPPT